VFLVRGTSTHWFGRIEMVPPDMVIGRGVQQQMAVNTGAGSNDAAGKGGYGREAAAVGGSGASGRGRSLIHLIDWVG
jgi:hypothetical protein